MSDDPLNISIDVIKPLSLAVVSVSIDTLNTTLSTIALCLSIIYSIYKLYKENKK